MAYAGLQVVLVLMFARVLPHAGAARGFARNYMLGDAIGGLIMLSSLLVDPPLRYWVWAIALLVLMAAPAFAVRAYEGQPFDSRHIPERYGLFTIIVLGESVVVVAARLGDVAARRRRDRLGAARVRHRRRDLVDLLRDRVVDVAVARAHRGVVPLGVRAPAGVRRYRRGSDRRRARDRGRGGELTTGSRSRPGSCCAAAWRRSSLSLVAVHTAEIGWWGAGMLQRWAAIVALLALAALGRGWPPALVVGAVFGVLVATAALDVAQHGGKGLAADRSARRRTGALDAVAQPGRPRSFAQASSSP